MSRTILVLGDQLCRDHPALAVADRGQDRILMLESREESPRMHRSKRVFHYAAMRHHAEWLRGEGWTVDYHSLPASTGLHQTWSHHVQHFSPDCLWLMEANNWSQARLIEAMANATGTTCRIFPTRQFLVSRAEFSKGAAGKKRLLMETHYRTVRTRLGILVEADGTPTGGAWNFDAANRRTVSDWKRDGAPRPPRPPVTPANPDPHVAQVSREVEEAFPDGTGPTGNCWLPVTREGALEGLETFVRERLVRFGDYQDLMLQDSPTMFHSLISGPLNIGLLTPLECVRAAESAYRAGLAPLAATEGFIRQIIGWREFVNGVYWLKMPDYLQVNALEARRPLPAFFRSGNTRMNCLSTVLREAIDSAYNHHIQRLMILGNFCLIAGIDPQQAHDWFLDMYVDAHEWVMAANVLGMALHADGGFMATKPYASSASYISKMSNYCTGCSYDPAKKSGPAACPFNLLYWDFYDRHTQRLGRNPRTAMMVKAWLKRPEGEREAILGEAAGFLRQLDAGDPV